MRLRTCRWLFAISFLLLVLSACSAISAQPGSTPALGTTGLRIKNTFNIFTVAWSPNGKDLALGGTKGTCRCATPPQGELRWAAQLWGAADALGTPLPPVDRAAYERSVAATRAQLGRQAFAAAWAEGRTMTPEQVLAAQGAATIKPR